MFSPMPPVPVDAELLTVEDYRATPEGSRYQLVEGDLLRVPSVNVFHQIIVGNLSLIFGRFVDRQPVGQFYFGPLDVYLSEHNVLQPDLLFVASANLGILAEDGVHGAPDLVIEVLSPATAQLDKKTKRRVYARAGVKEMWLVDPLLLQIQRYDFARDQAKPVQLIEEDESFTTSLLPGLTFAASEVFKR
jgi:Uma2 family endonuclease